MKKGPNKEPALACLDSLGEETMRQAWGDRNRDERRRIVVAAMIFGEQFEEQLATQPANADPEEARRLLMGILNASIDEFARREGLGKEAAAGFLGEVKTRDLILEFNEVLEVRVANPERPLDELLRKAVDSRLNKARWADHWSSG